MIEHISPYQQKVVSTLFADPVNKLKHKVLDNWHWWPAAAALFGFMNWADHKHHENARAEWP